MVEGVVNARLQPMVTLPVVGPSGNRLDIVSIVDTGFNDYLMLPSVVVEELGLEFVNTIEVSLASGSMEILPVFAATVLWDGQAREVFAIASTGMSLVGTRMLEDYYLHVEMKEGGKVLIESQG